MGHKGPPETDKHHLIPQCKREVFNVSHPTNIERINRKTHNAIHALFQEKCPHEQLQQWYKLHENILSKEARERIREIIQLEIKRFYLSHLIK